MAGTSCFLDDDAWRSIGDYLAEEFRLSTSPNSLVKAKSSQLTGGLTSPEEKITALYNFVQTSVKNLEFFSSADLAEAKKKRNDEESEQLPAKTLERGSGNSGDINFLFGALVRAAGFETRLAISPDRTRVLKLKGDRGWMFADRFWKPRTLMDSRSTLSFFIGLIAQDCA